MAKKPPVIDDKAFDNPFGRLAMELDPYCEGAPQGVMVNLLSAFSGYVSHETRVATGGYTSPLAAWFVLVGFSGKGRKGWTARTAMPVVRMAFKKWASEHVIESIPATGLGLMTELAEHDQSSVFVLEEEMDTFIKNAKSDTKVGEKLRKAWDGAQLRHKTSKADLVIENPHLGFVGHVQPKNWGAISGSRDATGGTYNRFLPIYVEQSKTIPVFGGPDPTEVREKAATKLRGMGAWALETGMVRVPEDVAAVFEEVHRPICEGLTEGSDELSEMAERALGYMIRISALYALGDKRAEISVRDLDSALELVRFAVDTIRYVLPATGGESLAQKILRALQESFDPVSGTYIDLSMTQVWDEIGRNYKKAEIVAALRELPQVSTYPGVSTGGRPPTMLRIDEESLEYRIHLAQEEFEAKSELKVAA